MLGNLPHPTIVHMDEVELFYPKAVEIGQPEEKPGVVIEPLFDPVPRENPREIPVEPRPVKTPELVPA